MADQPGYTRIPNTLLELLPTLPDAECRVLLAIIRKTAGWQKECDVISNSQIAAATGLSKQGVINGVAAAMKRGILKREKSGHNNGFCYQVVNEVDHLDEQSTKQTSQPNGLLVVNEVDHLSPQVVNEVDTQKKDLKERKERESGRAERAPRTPPIPKQRNLDAFNQAVLIYKELSGKTNLPPALITLIVNQATEMEHWRATVQTWIGSGFNPLNVSGMLDWYAHPEKMAAKQAQNGNKNGYTNGTRPAADLPLVTADPNRRQTPEEQAATLKRRQAIIEESRAAGK